MMWGYGGDALGWAMTMGGGLLFLIGVFFLVLWVVRSSGSGLTRDPMRDQPMDVLRGRLARGEITPDEFENIKKVLGA